MDRRPAARKGIALVLASGVLSLLLLVAFSFAALSRTLARQTSGAADRFRASLAAEGGMEYAASRLAGAGSPRYGDTMESRGDDMAFREPFGTPLTRARNVSFSHGEPWDSIFPMGTSDGIDNDGDGFTDELNEGNEVYMPGADFTDRNSDGRFTAASGRLRGGGEPWALRFVLKVECPQGKIPLNAGLLLAQDRFGDSDQNGPNGAPDHRDTEIFHHRGLVHVLNNLGALLLDPATGTRRWDVPTGDPSHRGDPIRASWLGMDLVGERPVGGYRDLEEAGEALVRRGYRPEEIGRILPFLDAADPKDVLAECGRPTKNPYMNERDLAPVHVPVQLATAPRPVLQALWMYMRFFPPPGIGTADTPWSRPCLRTSRDGAAAWAYTNIACILWPDEAEALADRLLAFRKGAMKAPAFYADLIAHAPEIFRADALELGDTDGDGAIDANPFHVRRWIQAKAHLAFEVLATDPGAFEGEAYLPHRGGWGADADPATPGVQHSAYTRYDYIQQIAYPRDPAVPPDRMWEPFSPKSPFWMDQAVCDLRPLGGTFAPPTRFSIESLGFSAGRPADAFAGVGGEVRTGERIDFTCQEDFENLAGGTRLACRGITVVDEPSIETRRDVRAGAGGEIQPHVATLPVWNRRAVETPAVGSEYPYFGYPRDAGSVVLAPFIGGAQGAKVYWPFTEDFDLRANNGGDAPADWTAGPARDFWHAGADPFADPSAPQHPFGWPSDPWTFVGRFMNPLQVTGGIQFQCPGLDTPPAPGNVLQEMTLAFWITAGLDKGPTSVFVKDIARLNTEIQITACRVDTEARQGIQFTVSTKWGNGSNVMVPPGPGSRAVTQWFLPDSRPDGDGVDNDGDGLTDEPWETRIPWIRHVVLAVEREGLETLFRLFVDGSDRVDPNDPATEMVHRHPDDMCVTDVEDLYASGIKDLRLYGTLLRDPEPRRLYEQGFFVRRGLFRSPLYVVDRMARFDRAQWTGVVPPQFFQAADASDPVHSAPLLDANGQPAPPVTPALTVVVRGYATAPDDPGHPREVFRRELEPGSVNDLSDLPPFRSFRYFVQFDCREVAGVLNDTPVFESVWFTFCRGGKPLVWTRWEAK